MNGMRWLVSVRAGTDLRRLLSRLEALGCSSEEGQTPVPVDDQQVIEVEGPRDLPRLARAERDIVKINPSSEMTLY